MHKARNGGRIYGTGWKLIGWRYSASFLRCAHADWIYKYGGRLFFMMAVYFIMPLGCNKGRSMDSNKAGGLAVKIQIRAEYEKQSKQNKEILLFNVILC